MVTPTANNQPVMGSNNTSKTPRPKPIKHTANVFFSAQNIIYYPHSLLYYINFLIKGDTMDHNKIVEMIEILNKTYPDAKCSLDFKEPFELVVAVMLSAQCTDERVNKTTPAIFAKYSTPYDFANIDIAELENLIHSCGFYKNKAKNIKDCANKIITDFGGTVPQTMEELINLPGVGRKSANVILLEVFGIAKGIAVDTHAKRISNLIGLSSEASPEKIEKDLLQKIPSEYWKDVNHLLIWHGRNICVARNPKCDICPVKTFCKYAMSRV